MSNLLLKLLSLAVQTLHCFCHFCFFGCKRSDFFLEVKDHFVIVSLFFGVLSILGLSFLQLLLKHLDLALEVIDFGLQVFLLQSDSGFARGDCSIYLILLTGFLLLCTCYALALLSNDTLNKVFICTLDLNQQIGKLATIANYIFKGTRDACMSLR